MVYHGVQGYISIFQAIYALTLKMIRIASLPHIREADNLRRRQTAGPWMLAALGGKRPSKVACHMISCTLHRPHEADLLPLLDHWFY